MQDKKPSDYKSCASEQTQPSLFTDEIVSRWKEQLNSITEEFKKLVESKNLRIISVSEVSPQIIQKDETKLGVIPDNLEMIVDGKAKHFLLSKFQDRNEPRFQDMCLWLRTILGDLLKHEHDTTWDPMTFPLQTQRPFGELQMPSKADIFGLSKKKPVFPRMDDPGRTEFWVHLPANNEQWMTVSWKCFVYCLRLIEISRVQSRDVLQMPSITINWDLFIKQNPTFLIRDMFCRIINFTSSTLSLFAPLKFIYM